MNKVLIIGGGPAGLFAAEELHKRGVRDILILDSGKRAEVRSCPLTSACNCSPCDILEGSGGSGGVSDGKMTFALDRGTQLEQIFAPEESVLLDYVEKTMLDFGVAGVRYEPSDEVIETGSRLRFSTYPLRHIGSDGVQEFSEKYSNHISELECVTLVRESRALSLLWEGNRVVGARVRVKSPGGGIAETDVHVEHVILAVGLWGVGWLEDQLVPHGVEFLSGAAGFGMRIETPETVMAPLFNRFYDFKVMGEYEGMTMRSFCCNRYGHIMPEYHKHLSIRNVNGHSFMDPARRSTSSNFSLQAKVGIDKVTDPQTFVRSVSRAVNALSNGYQGRQRIRDFLENRQPDSQDYDATVTYPQARLVNIASALPQFLYNAFSDYIRDLDIMIPGLIESGWLYAPEVKYHAKKLSIDSKTWRLNGIDGAFVLGDSTGLTGSYVSAALTGLIAARTIASTVLEEVEHA